MLGSIADAIVDISNNKKTQITEISQNLNSNNFRKGDLDKLETKLHLTLTKSQLHFRQEPGIRTETFPTTKPLLYLDRTRISTPIITYYLCNLC